MSESYEVVCSSCREKLEKDKFQYIPLWMHAAGSMQKEGYLVYWIKHNGKFGGSYICIVCNKCLSTNKFPEEVWGGCYDYPDEKEIRVIRNATPLERLAIECKDG